MSTDVVILLLLFDMNAFRKYLRLSPVWHHMALEAMDEQFNRMENDFLLKYHQLFFFKKSYTNSSIIQSCGKIGLRVDRVIVCEVLPSIEGKSISAGFSYRYTDTPGSENTYIADYKLDVVKKGSQRLVWIHKDEREEASLAKANPHIETALIQRPYIQPVTQICSGDTIEIAVNIFCMQGLVDTLSICWEQALF